MADIVTVAKQIVAAAEAKAAGGAEAHVQVRSEMEKLAQLVYTPAEKIARMRIQPLHNFALQIAIETGVLGALVQHDDSLTTVELAAETKAEDSLIYRVLRVLSSLGFVDETGTATFKANETTKLQVQPAHIGGMRMYSDCMFPVMGDVRKLLAGPGINQYPVEGKPSPFEAHFGSKFLTWMDENPFYRNDFSQYMAGRRAPGLPQWFEVFPAAEKASEDPNLKQDGAILIVDVGGNKGHEMIKFRHQNPSLPGRIIVQDLPGMLAHVDEDSKKEIDYMAYDFFTPQPVAGARFYYHRAVFHNWNDEPAAQIAANVAKAMKPGYSTLLIDDFVMPDTGASTASGSLDLAMMLLGIGMERTMTQWTELLGGAGLEILKVWRSKTGYECVIEAQLKQ